MEIEGEKSYEMQAQFPEWNIMHHTIPSKLILELKLYVSLKFTIIEPYESKRMFLQILNGDQWREIL
jgi:hypothetical protein